MERWSEHSFLVEAYSGTERLGYVAIDTSIGGRATGGLRMASDTSAEEVRDLARSMTLKFGLFGLPQGGAKGCVVADPEGPEEERGDQLEAFGRAIVPLLSSRLYQPDVDMGTRAGDIERVLAVAGMHSGGRRLRSPRSGLDTARTVMAGVRAALRRLDRPVEGATVAVEGFGSVGGALAGLLDRDGARVMAISTSRGAVADPAGLEVEELQRAAGARGSAFVEDVAGERLEPDALLELDVDVVCPCARWRAYHDGNVADVRARVICPGANAAVTRGAEEVLADRGVLVIPDFVANCGGVLGGTMTFAGVRAEVVEHVLTHRWEGWIDALLEESSRRGERPRSIAEPYALARHGEARVAAEQTGPTRRLFDLGLEMHRRGWIPEKAVGRLAEGWFESRTEPVW